MYRLIKKYPSLPIGWELGMEVGIGDNKCTYSPCNSKYIDCYIDARHIEDYPEYWEKVEELCVPIGTKFKYVHNNENIIYTIEKDKEVFVKITWILNEEKNKITYTIKQVNENFKKGLWVEYKEKDYEILSFKHSQGLTTLKDNGKYFFEKCDDFTLGATLEEILFDKYSFPNHKIYSVKRLSDNQVFTVGDRVKQSNVKHNNSFIITGFKFDVSNEHLLAIGNGGIKLHKIEKVPLFITFDNVDIFEGDEFYMIAIPFNDKKQIIYKQIATDHYKNNQEISFSTIEKAEEYILTNKPCLSFNDVVEVFNITSIHSFKDELKERILNKLKETEC